MLRFTIEVLIFHEFGRLFGADSGYTDGRRNSGARIGPPYARAPTTLKICPVREAVSPPHLTPIIEINKIGKNEIK